MGSQVATFAVAWPDQDMMWFDRQYEPVVLGQRMFVGSSRTDSLTAYDTRSGASVWEFRAEGPIRFAPVGRGTTSCLLAVTTDTCIASALPTVGCCGSIAVDLRIAEYWAMSV